MLSLAALLHAMLAVQASPDAARSDLPAEATSVAPPPPIVTAPAATGGRPAEPAPLVTRARALAPLSSLISMDDYPASALRARAEGDVHFRLAIGANGRVSGCVVIASSGNSALDMATCRIMRSRARFEPARNRNGPAADVTVARHRWRIEG